MKTVEDKFEEYKGKYVPVRVHLLSHMGKPKEMMYIGDCKFVNSREEYLNQSISFNGLSGSLEHAESENGVITLYNWPDSDVPKKLILDEAKLEETKKLWKNRS